MMLLVLLLSYVVDGVVGVDEDNVVAGVAAAVVVVVVDLALVVVLPVLVVGDVVGVVRVLLFLLWLWL